MRVRIAGAGLSGFSGAGGPTDRRFTSIVLAPGDIPGQPFADFSLEGGFTQRVDVVSMEGVLLSGKLCAGALTGSFANRSATVHAC